MDLQESGKYMYIIILLIITVLMICSVVFRVALLNLFSCIKYGLIDLFEYITKYKFNTVKYGGIIFFQGNFGHGKTLSAVHMVSRLYNRYNGRYIYDSELGKVKQYIQVVTNVHFNNIPYVPLNSLQEIVELTEKQPTYDKVHNIKTKTIVLIDESSCYLNSRSYKSNINPLFLNFLIQNRKAGITHFILISQKFCLTDKLMRDVTEVVINCRKIWRFMVHYCYLPEDLESSSNLQNLKPIKRYGWFIHDKDYNAYSTTQMCNRLVTQFEENPQDFISETDILALQQGFVENPENVRNKSHSLKKRLKRK